MGLLLNSIKKWDFYLLWKIVFVFCTFHQAGLVDANGDWRLVKINLLGLKIALNLSFFPISPIVLQIVSGWNIFLITKPSWMERPEIQEDKTLINKTYILPWLRSWENKSIGSTSLLFECTVSSKWVIWSKAASFNLQQPSNICYKCWIIRAHLKKHQSKTVAQS